jgi:hypothetical protein
MMRERRHGKALSAPRHAALWNWCPGGHAFRLFSDGRSVGPEKIAAEHLVRDIGEVRGHPVGDDQVGPRLEGRQIARRRRTGEIVFRNQRLIDGER